MTAPLVLVVDDSPLVTEALGTLLELAGYRALAAGSLAEAIAASGAAAPDAVLLDLTLPDGDGLALLDALREGGALPAVLALTGHDDAETADRCLTAGCRAVLAKPVRAAVLLRALREAGVPPANDA